MLALLHLIIISGTEVTLVVMCAHSTSHADELLQSDAEVSSKVSGIPVQDLEGDL